MKLWSMVVQSFQVEKTHGHYYLIIYIMTADLLSLDIHLISDLLVASHTALSEKLYVIKGGCGAGRYVCISWIILFYFFLLLGQISLVITLLKHTTVNLCLFLLVIF